MKKFLLFSFITFSLTHTTYGIFGWGRSTDPDCPFSSVFSSLKTMIQEGKHAAKLYFNSTYIDVHWHHIPLEYTLENFHAEKEHQKKLFGYDLAIEYIHDELESEAFHPTLYFHGWQDIGRSAKLLKRYCKVLPGDVITFNFPDAMPLMAPFWKSSFGQLPDILPALYTLKYIITKKNLIALDLYGISRGGATIINMIALLYNDDLFEQHRAALERIGITNYDRKIILKVLKRGCIVLDIPLRSMKETIAPKTILSKITQYTLDGLDPVETARLIGELKLKILVHFQHSDHVVFNSNEGTYFENLAHKNLKNTYLVMGNDGGHIHTHQSLSKTIRTFKKLGNTKYFKPSYYPEGLFSRIESSSFELAEGKIFTFSSAEYIQPVIERYHNKNNQILAEKKRPKNYRYS